MKRQGQKTMAAPGRRARGGRPIARGALAAALVVAAALAAVTAPARATLYKWVDEKGVVHYTDKLPPDAVDKASVELNRQGVPLKKTDKALTAEQRRALERDAERQREAAKQREEVARRDRALVSSYMNEEEIDLARKRALQTVETMIQSSLSFSEQLHKRKADAEARRIEARGKPNAAVIDRELETIDAELVRQAEIVAQKRREAAAVSAKYDGDKQRWRELVAAKSASTANGSGPGAAAGKK